MAFSAGAMLYVVVEELIPETQQGEHSNIGTIAFDRTEDRHSHPRTLSIPIRDVIRRKIKTVHF